MAPETQQHIFDVGLIDDAYSSYLRKRKPAVFEPVIGRIDGYIKFSQKDGVFVPGIRQYDWLYLSGKSSNSIACILAISLSVGFRVEVPVIAFFVLAGFGDGLLAAVTLIDFAGAAFFLDACFFFIPRVFVYNFLGEIH
ncbi:MAG TPA: hypothetical protein VIJ75_19940 [Hanamia sp.]